MFSSMFSFIKLTSGRRMHALRQMHALATGLGEAPLVAHLAEAMAHEREVQHINQRWQGRRRGASFPVELQALDDRLDHTVSALRDVLMAFVKGAEPEDPLRQCAERLMDALFPGGVYAITSLPYVEEMAAVDGLLHALSHELAADAETLQLGLMVARLQQAADEYRAALDRADNLRFATVKAARERGHEFMLEAVALVLGRYFKVHDAGHAERREMLLAPILVQDEAMRAYLKARRRGQGASEDELDAGADDAVVVEGSASAPEMAPAGVGRAVYGKHADEHDRWLDVLEAEELRAAPGVEAGADIEADSRAYGRALASPTGT